jgi:hypothetical protein
MAATVVLSILSFLWVLGRTIRRLDIAQVHKIYGVLIRKAVDKIPDYLTIRRALVDMAYAAEFSLESGHTDDAIQAYDVFIEAVGAWGKSYGSFSGYLKTIDPRTGDAKLQDIEDIIEEGARGPLATAAQKQNPIAYRKFLVELSAVSNDLPTHLKDTLREIIRSSVVSAPMLVDPELTHAAIVAVLASTLNSLDSDEAESLEFCRELLAILNEVAVGQSSAKAKCVQALGIILHAVENHRAGAQESKKWSTIREEYLQLFVHYGINMVSVSDEGLHSVWLSILRGLVLDLFSKKEYGDAKALLEMARDAYHTAFLHQCTSFCAAYLTLLRSLLNVLPKEKKVSEDFCRSVLELRIASPSDSVIAPFSSVMIWAYQRAYEILDVEVAEEALRMVFELPLRASLGGSAILVFLNNAVVQADKLGNESFGGILIEQMSAALLDENREIDELYREAMLRMLTTLAGSTATNAEMKELFIGTCGRLQTDHRLQELAFASLNTLVDRVRTPRILAAAEKVYRSSGFLAAENMDEQLLRRASSYMGWLAYRTITADISLSTKAKVLKDVLNTAVTMKQIAVRCHVSQATVLFLGTLFAVLGAVCEELDQNERKPLLRHVLSAAVGWGDQVAMTNAIITRELTDMGISELNGKGTGPYDRFLSDLQGMWGSSQAASSGK